MKKLSGVVVCYNEEEKIDAALGSLEPVSDEIVVVDSFSSDGTEAICRRYTDRFLQRPWSGYRDQKQFATQQASFDWVLSLDADEVLSPELRQAVLLWKSGEDDGIDGYRLCRKTFFLGRWIEHTTWYPDWQMRLFRRSAGRWEGGRVHESFRVNGATGRLSGDLHHHTYASLSEYLQQLERFTNLAAADYFDAGVRAGPLAGLGDPAGRRRRRRLLAPVRHRRARVHRSRGFHQRAVHASVVPNSRVRAKWALRERTAHLCIDSPIGLPTDPGVKAVT